MKPIYIQSIFLRIMHMHFKLDPPPFFFFITDRLMSLTRVQILFGSGYCSLVSKHKLYNNSQLSS